MHSMTSNGEHPDAHAAGLFAPRINPLDFVTLEPCFMHHKEHLSALIQKLLVGFKMSTIEVFGVSPPVKP